MTAISLSPTEVMAGMGALAALSTLLDLALKAGVASSNVPLFSAPQTSRDQNRGEAHGVLPESETREIRDSSP